MFGRFYQIVCCAALTLVVGAGQDLVRAAEAYSEFKVGSWEGAAYRENGDFAYCLAGRLGNGRKYLMVLRAPSIGYALAVYDSTSPFKRNATYSTVTRIDSRWTLRAEGVGATADLLRIRIPEAQLDEALDHIAKGSRLRVDVGGARLLSASLRGSRNALDRLERCYAENVQLARSDSGKDTQVQASRRVRRLAEAVGLPAPGGSLGALRKDADTLDAAAVILLGLALIDLPERMLYDDEATSWITLAADAGDVRALYVLGRMMQMGLTSAAYDGHAEELIGEAADGGLAQALVDRAKWLRPQDPSAALQDIQRAAQRGHAEAADLLAAWQQAEPAQAASPPPAQTSGNTQPAASPPPHLAVSRSTVPEGEQVEARFSNLPEQGTNWIALAAADHAPDQYFDLAMLESGTLSGSHRFKPLPAGAYQVRLYLNWPDGGYAIEDAVDVTIADQAPPPAAAAAPPRPTTATPLEDSAAAPPAAQPASPSAASAPSPASPGGYTRVGNQACFGEAAYPETWRKDAKCWPQGCLFGEHPLEACLAIAGSRKAAFVMHGLPQGLWPNECWLGTSCTDLRDQPDFTLYRSDSPFPSAVSPEVPTADLRIAPLPVSPNSMITVSVVAPATFGAQTWLGLFPADAEGGDPATNARTALVREEVIGDARTFRFPAPSREGRYEIRMSDPDLDAELARSGFDVRVDREAATLDLPKSDFSPGETVEIAFTASPDYSPDSWIGIVPGRTPNGSAGRNMLHALTTDPLEGRAAGTVAFPAPEAAGSYEVRLNDPGNDLELASVAFTVTAREAPTPETAPATPGETGEASVPAPSLDLVISVQSLLAVLGYDAGLPDGQMSTSTIGAVRAFQRDAGLRDDGQVTPALRDALLAQLARSRETSQ